MPVLLSQIQVNPKNPRIIKDQKFAQLVTSLRTFPEMLEKRPIVIDNGIALGGNQRTKAIEEIVKKPTEQDHEIWLTVRETQAVPDTWISDATAWTAEQKQQFIIKDNISYGEWEWQLLTEDYDNELLADWGLDIPDFNEPEEIINSPYSRNIKAPVYEPVNEKPLITDLFNTEKTNQLLEAIKAAPISAAEKKFLVKAAQRHTIFNFEKIADYYAHAPKEVQELFEQSALVIIDFNKAIEYGFIELTKNIQEQYATDYDAK